MKNNIFVLAILFIIAASACSLTSENMNVIFNFSKRYKGSQRIHEGEITRLSGFVMFISLLFFYHFNHLEELTKYKHLIFFITPFMFVIFVEDIFQNCAVFPEF